LHCELCLLLHMSLIVKEVTVLVVILCVVNLIQTYLASVVMLYDFILINLPHLPCEL
jgi:hypothetical protein